MDVAEPAQTFSKLSPRSDCTAQRQITRRYNWTLLNAGFNYLTKQGNNVICLVIHCVHLSLLVNYVEYSTATLEVERIQKIILHQK